MLANNSRTVAILGPTCTGKSDLALWLAEETNGEIINADSMQIYKYFDIGTAKPEENTLSRVPHHLTGVVCPDEEFNAAAFQRMADAAIRDVTTRGRVPIIVGGTGLYLRVLFHGLFPVQSDPDLRARLRRQYLEEPERMYEELKAVDPEYARAVSARDGIRIVRALEISRLSGQTMSRWQRQHGFREQRYEALMIGLRVERKELYRRIDDRVERMLDRGWVDEVRRLLTAGWDPGLKPFQSIGYREIVLYLKDAFGYEEMVEKIKTATRRYAKRQMTWFSREDAIEWYEYPALGDAILQRVRRFLID
jgi:tRNA dimethylallyltransferase